MNIYDTASKKNLNENNSQGPYGPLLCEKTC
jgi:hypothetical protein